jgi:hypothetical protein
MKKIFAYKDANGHPVYPNVLRFSEDGKVMIPIFYKGETSGTGNRSVDEENSKPALTEEIKLRLGKTLFGAKANAKAVTPNSSIPKPKSDPLKLF